MAEDRRLHILSRLTSGLDAEAPSARSCEVAAEVTALSGAGIMLMAGDTSGGSLCTTDDVSAIVEELQYTELGQCGRMASALIWTWWPWRSS